MSFGFRDVGSFSSEAAAERWARDNNIDLRDLKTSRGSDGSVQASVRSSGTDERYTDRPGGRRDGWI